MLATPPQSLPTIPSRETIVTTIQRLNEEHNETINDIVKNIDFSTASFQNVLKPIADIENLQASERDIIAALRYASPDPSTQNAVEEAERLDVKYQAIMDKRSDLLNLIQAVKTRRDDLDHEDNRLLEKFLLRFSRCGFSNLNTEELQEYFDLTLKLETLCTEFNRNIREYQGGLYFARDEVSGIPTSHLASFKSGQDAKLYIPLRRRELSTVLRYASSSDTRKRMQIAWGEHLSENTSLFKQAALLRDRQARLLGYKSHAQAVLPNRMAPSVEWVEKLLNELAHHLAPVGQKELTDIGKKKQHLLVSLNPTATVENVEVEPWDVLYYRRMLEDDREIDHDRIREYFPLRHTFDAILQLFATYLQLRFEQVSTEETLCHTWTQDVSVSVYGVWDEGNESNGAFIGYLYADLLDRPNKYKGNQAVRLQPGCKMPGGKRLYPVCTIMCSFPASISDPHHLLEHSELKSLFHELGHCMHDLLAKTKYQQFHGYNVCLEFGEAIGIMFESWVWMEDILYSLSYHYTRISPDVTAKWKENHTGEELPPLKIPTDLLKPWLETFKPTRAIRLLQELCDSMFDLKMHNPASRDDLEALDGVLLYKTLQARLLLVERPELGYLHTCHAHLMSGMDAGYYAYISANVFAEEVFHEAFSQDHNCIAAWRRFRREILEYGGSLDEDSILERFLGRPPSISTLLDRLGIDRE